jgi:hypothetical protein
MIHWIQLVLGQTLKAEAERLIAVAVETIGEI